MGLKARNGKLAGKIVSFEQFHFSWDVWLLFINKDNRLKEKKNEEKRFGCRFSLLNLESIEWGIMRHTLCTSRAEISPTIQMVLSNWSRWAVHDVLSSDFQEPESRRRLWNWIPKTNSGLIVLAGTI